VGIALGVLTSACTELKVKQLPTGVIEGIPYALPQKSFLITTEYSLADCTVKLTAEKKWTVVLETSQTIGVVPVTEVDQKHRFYIPYSTLRNAFKDTDITIESYDNQTLKSVSATVNDKTGETITAAIGTALRIATIATGVTSFDAATLQKEEDLRKLYCGDEAIRALNEIKKLKGSGAAPAKAAGKADAKDAPKPADADAAAARIAQIKAQYLTHKEVLRWTPAKPQYPQGTTPNSKTVSVEIYPKAFLDKEKWIKKAGIATQDLDNGRIKRMITYVFLDLDEIIEPDPPLGDSPAGFVLRNAPTGLLRVCDAPCPAAFGGDVGNVLSAAEHVVPQLGRYVVMPLKNRAFENQTLVINLSADGAITKLGLKSNATAPAALTSLNADLEAINKAKAAHDKAKADAMTAAAAKDKDHANSVKDQNNAVAECLAAQQAVVDAGGTATGTCQ
jgi:hypothetical protein